MGGNLDDSVDFSYIAIVLLSSFAGWHYALLRSQQFLRAKAQRIEGLRKKINPIVTKSVTF